MLYPGVICAAGVTDPFKVGSRISAGGLLEFKMLIATCLFTIAIEIIGKSGVQVILDFGRGQVSMWAVLHV